MLSPMLTLLIFLAVLSVLVLIHEAGHYLAARLFGVKADEFGYGLPPRLIGIVKTGGKWKWVRRNDQKTYQNTIWSLNWLPIGGFVRIKGEQGEGIHDVDAFHVKPIWQRIIILAAGVGMNWLLAAVLFSIGLMAGAPAVLEHLPPGAVVEDRSVTVMEVLPSSPAADAGIRAGDMVVRVGEKEAVSLEQVRAEITAHGTQSMPLALERNGEAVSVTVTPRHLEEAGRVAIGIGMVDTGVVRYPFWQAIRGGAVLTVSYTQSVVLTFLDLFRELVRGDTNTASQITGPVGIAVTTGHIAQQGFAALLQFTAILSINLAVVNFLPIPALDGGRALFLVVEALRKKAMNRGTEALVHNISFLILVGLILLITVRDLGRYGGMILGGLRGMIGL
ncbi:MAG: metalloprotease RasP [Candidatus Parcubacteria bacterium]|jgi:regulator of sigma E protease